MLGSVKIAEGSRAESDRLGKVAAISPLLEELAGRIDRESDLPRELVAALHGQNLYRMLLPAELGGAEVTPPVFTRVIEAIARIDASTAWCLGQTASCSMCSATLDHATAQDVFGRSDAVLAWGPGRGRADLVDGAWVLSGEWHYGSGSRQATWLGGLATLYEGGREVVGSDGKPMIRTLLFPAAKAEFKRVWDVIGLRGTGSDSYSCKDVRVPSTHSIVQDSISERRVKHPLYAFTSRNVYAIGFAGIALGVAAGMLDILADLSGKRIPKGQEKSIKGSPVLQSQFAQAAAQIESSRSYLHATVDRVWNDLAASGADAMPLGNRVALRLAASHAIKTSAKVGEFAFHAAGAQAIFTGNPIERRVRDMIALRQHIQGRDDLFELCGQYLLGGTPEFVLV
jgi:alkylation response protein AidB-like acyl-CoA dehydrogenase